jgi:hypothetical protein
MFPFDSLASSGSRTETLTDPDSKVNVDISDLLSSGSIGSSRFRSNCENLGDFEA